MNNKIRNMIDIAHTFFIAIICILLLCMAISHKEMYNDYNEKIYALTEQLNYATNRIALLESDLIEMANAKEPTKADVNYDYDYVLRVVAAECRGEPFDGQMAVVQTIRERAKQRGLTPEEVVKQPNQYASPVPMSLVTESVREACWRVLINGESVTDKPIQHFYSTAGGFVSKTHEKLTYVMTIGYHKFFMG